MFKLEGALNGMLTNNYQKISLGEGVDEVTLVFLTEDLQEKNLFRP